MRSTLLWLGFSSLASAQYDTPAGAAMCGVNLAAKEIPANGDCSISGGLFSIGFPVELLAYLAKKGFYTGSGSEDPKGTVISTPEMVGTGPYPAGYSVDPGLPGHTIYAPLKPPDVEMPILTWGNGGCGPTPHSGSVFSRGYDGFLKEIASHGFVIVADGPMPGIQTQVKDMLASVKWAKSGGAKAYGKVDATKIATMGHSCGGLEGLSTSYHNPDIALTIMFNIATFHDDKRYLLKELKAPIAWFVGNPSDMGYENSRRDYGNLTEGHPAYWAALDTGHMSTFEAANGGKAAKAAVAFLQWQFRGDAKAKEYSLNGIKGDNWNVLSKNWK